MTVHTPERTIRMIIDRSCGNRTSDTGDITCDDTSGCANANDKKNNKRTSKSSRQSIQYEVRNGSKRHHHGE